MNKVEAVLFCGHSVRLTVNGSNTAVSSDAYCRHCGWSQVILIHEDELRVLCRHCQFGRWVGQDEREAGRVVRNHERNRRHECFIVRDTVTASGGTPRKILVSNHEKLLRASEIESNLVLVEADEEPPPF